MAFVIAPSSGPVHRYPVDCYRFYPDSFAAIAEWCGLRLVHSWTDERGPWCDITGVFQKGGKRERIETPRPHRIAINESVAQHPDEAAEQRKGARHYLDVLRDLHRLIQPHLYLEIGVRQGSSLSLSTGRAVGIDPDPHPDFQCIRSDMQLFRCSSDDFFFFFGKSALVEPVQLAFIDGLNLAEYVLRDFMNVERCMSPDGIIVIDDVLPNHPTQAQRQRTSRVWTGDVWRFTEWLGQLRPGLKLTWLDTDPTGLLVISRVDPGDTTLWSSYNSIARKLDEEQLAWPPVHLIDRSQATQPDEMSLRSATDR
jgi:predicted O-methyltransferase YrrM